MGIRMNELTHFSCFSGIDGFSVAAHRAGFRTVGQVEIGDYPNKVLERRFKDVPRWRDIKDVTEESIRQKLYGGGDITGVANGQITVMSGGFPC
jgi:DNA (cytosine-5)-methyltransferase 1